MKTKITLIITFVLFHLINFNTFAQNLSLKSATGNGALFDGVTIIHPQLGFNLKTIGTMTLTPIEGYDEVYVSFGFKPTPSKYRYNGKIYPDRTPSTSKCAQYELPMYMDMKITASVNIEGKTYTGTVDKATIGGPLATRVTIKLPNVVKSNSKITLTSITVEALPSPGAEKVIQDYEKCLQREKEQKEAAEKEKAKKETTKTDDDFWSGGKSETEKKEMTIVALTISNDDFWSGKEEKPKEESREKDEKKEVGKEEKKVELDGYGYICFFIWEGEAKGRYCTNVFKTTRRTPEAEKWGKTIWDDTDNSIYPGNWPPTKEISDFIATKLNGRSVYVNSDINLYRWSRTRSEAESARASENYVKYWIDDFYPYGE